MMVDGCGRFASVPQSYLDASLSIDGMLSHWKYFGVTKMDRRKFLLASAATLVVGRAHGQMNHGAMDQSMPDMKGMMGGNKGKPISLPEGAPLREPAKLINTSSEPGKFVAKIIAAPAKVQLAKGLETPILAYNGQTPGPLIELTEGDHVEISFANRIPKQDSTIHWHGLVIPSNQDGGPREPVKSGSERVYAFDIAANSAGSFWYHPHPHGKAAEQVYRGLAGALIVKSKLDPIPPEFGDTVLFMSDLRLAADGTLPPSTMIDIMNGRVGDHILVNGQKNPLLTLPSGTSRRFRLYNATSARFLRMTFGNLPVTIVGTDGGLLEAPVNGGRDIMLAPAERLEIIVTFPTTGIVKLTTLAYDHGWMGPGWPRDEGITLLSVNVTADKAYPATPLPTKLRNIAELGAPALTRRFSLSETMGMDANGMTMGFLINGKSFDMQRVDEVSQVGQVELWEINNPTDMDHPFHIHGTQFQVTETERAGVITKMPFRALKDTVNIKRGETVRLLTRQDLPGVRMYHCHILEHEDLGMMGQIDVKA